MNILFTGVSSFTGYWFVRMLARSGHRVVAPLRSAQGAYQGVKAARIAQLGDCCEIHHGIHFGDEAFGQLIQRRGPFDVLCHHAAEVRDYRSPDFDAVAALANNARNLAGVLRQLAAGGCRKIVLTGSVFEPDEGLGEQPLRAFSPYGLSKGMTSQTVRHYAWREGYSLGKFVIPNPFGPMEEPRFTSFLVKSWLSGQTPAVKTPDYLRDNIHVDLLALAYERMVRTLPAEPGFARLGPSQYVLTQGAFAQLVGAQMEKRLGKPCPVRLEKQTDFSEPVSRINPDKLDPADFGWDESAAWDALAEYYRPA